MTPLQAAAGVGYGEGFAANSHRFAPGGMLAAVKYLIEELHADVNAFDHEGNTALHHAAARGDVEMIQYLVSKGADVKAVTREGKTTADMANGPVQRIQPWPGGARAAREARARRTTTSASPANLRISGISGFLDLGPPCGTRGGFFVAARSLRLSRFVLTAIQRNRKVRPSNPVAHIRGREICVESY